MTSTILNGNTFRDFEEYVRNSYTGNNHVYKLEVQVKMYDGPKPLVLTFTSPEGFEQDQTRRRGTIERLTE